MYDLTPRRLKNEAAQRLSQVSYHPGRLAVLHSLPLLGMLVLDLIFYVLDLQIAKTGGLAGMGTRTALASTQSVLNLGYSLAMIFWRISFVYCGVKLARGETAIPRNFTRGFQRFGPVLRLFLVEGVIYFFMIMLAAQLASILFLMTPYADRMVQAVESVAADGMLDEAAMEAMLPSMLPLYWILLPVLGVLCIPVFYRLRFTRFIIQDDPRVGALTAVRLSWLMSRGNRWELCKLDLSFWWYYLLLAVATFLTDGAYYLDLLGVALPMPGIVATMLLRAVGIGVSLLIAWCWQSYVQTTCAVAYDTILHPAVPDEA